VELSLVFTTGSAELYLSSLSNLLSLVNRSTELNYIERDFSPENPDIERERLGKVQTDYRGMPPELQRWQHFMI
jgi:hypothetical protein